LLSAARLRANQQKRNRIMNKQELTEWAKDNGDSQGCISVELLCSLLDANAIVPSAEIVKHEKTMEHLNMYRLAINEIDDFFEYANESDSDKKKIREILHKLTGKLMFSIGKIKPLALSKE